MSSSKTFVASAFAPPPSSSLGTAVSSRNTAAGAFSGRGFATSAHAAHHKARLRDRRTALVPLCHRPSPVPEGGGVTRATLFSSTCAGKHAVEQHLGGGSFMSVRLLTLVWPAVVGCIPVPDGTRPEVKITEGPVVREAAASELYLVNVLEVSTDEPTFLTVELSGAGTARRIIFPTESMTHAVPLLGLVENEIYVAEVSLRTETGLEVTAEPVEVHAGEASIK